MFSCAAHKAHRVEARWWGQMAMLTEFREQGNQHKCGSQGSLPGGGRASAGPQRAGRTQVREEEPSGGKGEGGRVRGGRVWSLWEVGSQWLSEAAAWRREAVVLTAWAGSMETMCLTTREPFDNASCNPVLVPGVTSTPLPAIPHLTCQVQGNACPSSIPHHLLTSHLAPSPAQLSSM